MGKDAFAGLESLLARGRERQQADAERNIPLRENGALVWLTRAEWDAREAAK